MSFFSALKTCYFSKLFNIKDRAPRSEFWWWMSFNIVHCIGFFITSFLVVFGSDLFLIGVLVLLAYVMLSMTTLVIRRLHDMNLSAWWIVPWYVILLAGPSAQQDEIAGAGVTTAFIILCIAMLFKGTTGPNRFGPDPVALAQAQAAEAEAEACRHPSVEGCEDWQKGESTDFMHFEDNNTTQTQPYNNKQGEAVDFELLLQQQQHKSNKHQQGANDTDYMFSRKYKD